MLRSKVDEQVRTHKLGALASTARMMVHYWGDRQAQPTSFIYVLYSKYSVRDKTDLAQSALVLETVTGVLVLSLLFLIDSNLEYK